MLGVLAAWFFLMAYVLFIWFIVTPFESGFPTYKKPPPPPKKRVTTDETSFEKRGGIC